MPKLTTPGHKTTGIIKQQLKFDTRADSSFIRQSHVLEVVPFSAATLWRMVRAGTFPAPVKLSARVTAWKCGDVREWLSAQSAK